VIKYLGSKRKLIPAILEQVGPAEGRTVLDLFSGTSRVGHALKREGFAVHANDHNAYAHVLAKTYVEADAETFARDAARLIEELNQLPGAPGYFTATFCESARYLHPKNGARVDAIRRRIAELSLDPVLEAVLLTSLIEAADRVDSTCGVQMAYLKSWAKRAHQDLELRLPALLPRAPAGPGRAHRLDALEAARSLSVDVAYLDPPYNQHSYLGNYHVWETLAAGDSPEVYGTANKRVDVKSRRSVFNSRPGFKSALAEVIRAVDAKRLVVSFSDEGFIDREDMEVLLAERGPVTSYGHDYKRYVGAQIGIHNPKGEKVGKVSHLRNKEFLFVVDVETPPVRSELPAEAAPTGQAI